MANTETPNFNTYTTVEILEQGLSSMTKACDALTDQNNKLIEDIKGLQAQVKRMQDKLIINKT